MKAKEAIELIKSESKDDKDLYKGLCEAFEYEVSTRVKLRAHNKKPTDGVVVSVVDEVCDWSWKVGRGIEMTEEYIKLAVDSERGVAFAKYQVLDLKAVSQMKKMRKAYLSGKHPIDVLTKEGLDAIVGMTIGNLTNTARQLGELGMRDSVQTKKLANELRLSNKPFCPYGVEARHCPECETLYDRREGPFPQSVEQLQFYCKGNPKKCDWSGDEVST